MPRIEGPQAANANKILCQLGNRMIYTRWVASCIGNLLVKSPCIGFSPKMVTPQIKTENSLIPALLSPLYLFGTHTNSVQLLAACRLSLFAWRGNLSVPAVRRQHGGNSKDYPPFAAGCHRTQGTTKDKGTR